VMIEALPDSTASVAELTAALADRRGAANLAVASRTILSRLGLARAELRKTAPLAFACRCSPERAAAMLGALSAAERADLPPTIDITCHMCGRTWSVKTK